MNDHAELDRFKTEINLSHFAASRGYTLDKRESSRNSAVMRHADGDKIIIAREGQHWIYFSVRKPRLYGLCQRREQRTLVFLCVPP
jgi:hypothetical protein